MAMTERTGIVVTLHDPDGTVAYPDATSAMVAPDGCLVVLRSRPRGFPEAVDRVPRDRWASWSPSTAAVPSAKDLDARA
jgi:hypothetical protein